MSLTHSISSALNGIRTSQKAIDVVSENVSNVNTEGYSRKVYSQQTLVLNNGVSSGAVSNTDLRQVDTKMLAQLRKETGILQEASVRSYYLDLIQAKMGQPSSEYSVSNRVNAIQTAFESLGVDSDKLNSQSTAVTALDTSLSQMRDLSSQIQALRMEIDQEISALCDEVTGILEQLDKLNDDIVRTTAVGGQSADNYKDQRDMLITRLSEIMDIQSYERSTGETVILTGGGKPLLDKDGVIVSHTPAASTGSLISYSSGGITGIYAGKFDITKEISSGEMSGLIKLRDTELQDMQTQLDELAYQMTKQMNAVHNQGTSYPNTVYEMTGTRTFIDGGQQTITLSGGDVKIILFDQEGVEAYSTSLTQELAFTSGSIDSMCQAIENWLQTAVDGPHLSTASVGLDRNGNLAVDLGSSAYSISFQDEISVLRGSDAANISIGFDADGNGIIDQTHSGFSNFFGLNDLIVTSKQDSVYESEIFSSASLMGIKGKTILNFSDTANGLNFASIDVTAADTIKTIAEKINTALVDASGNQIVKADLVQEGAGYRLRLSNIDGNQMEITETLTTVNGITSSSILNRLGLGVSHAGSAAELNVRPDILETPGHLNTGKVQYSSVTGSYFISETDNSLANDFAAAFTKTITFGSAGSFTKTTATMANYAASIVSGLAVNLNEANSTNDYQTELVTTIYRKEQDVSGVDLDEELALMLQYQRSYSAAAKALTTSLEMLELLDSIV
ncbi:MAG: flagellar hook-associated protein FlgK [Alphaproteobacteria bacterium]|nr:flagellar hook-associated protein FlgK [Alphaproteobacteria bacterium]